MARGKKWGMLSPIFYPVSRIAAGGLRATAATVSYSPEACASG